MIVYNELLNKNMYGSKEHYDQRTSMSVECPLVSENVRTIIYYSTYIYTCPLIVMLLLYTILRIFIRVR